MNSPSETLRAGLRKILEDELEWGVKTGKTIRLHKIIDDSLALILNKLPDTIELYNSDGEAFEVILVDTIKQILEGK